MSAPGCLAPVGERVARAQRGVGVPGPREFGGRGVRTSQPTVAEVLSALRDRGPQTRTELLAATGLSRATVSTVLRRLLADGLVSERRPGGGQAPGRPAAVVRLNPARVHVVGLEVGRAHVAAAVADAAGEVGGEVAETVPVAWPVRRRVEASLGLLDRLAVDGDLDLSGMRAIAVGTPGPVFSAPTRLSPDMALSRAVRERSEVAKLLTDRFGVVVEVDNNTRATALGEATSGAAAQAANAVYLRVDAGVGGGIIADGRLLDGRWGAAGELGHVVVDPVGRRCPCGGRGCLELVASAPALLAATGEPDLGQLSLSLARGEHRAALAGAARAVAQVLAGAAAATDPSVIVLGGAVADLPGFLDSVESGLSDFLPSWCSAEISVRRAAGDRTAGARGCLVLARRRLEVASRPARRLRATAN